MNRRQVVKLSAQWCTPCRMYAPIFNEVKAKLEAQGIDFLEIDVDEQPEAAYKYKVRSVPTTVVIEDSLVLRSQAGSMSYSDLEKFITK
jgi:thiol-disulfide isomerase/thioredoxin